MSSQYQSEKSSAIKDKLYMRLIMKYCEKFGNDPYTLKTIKDVVNTNLMNDKTELNALVSLIYIFDSNFTICVETKPN